MTKKITTKITKAIIRGLRGKHEFRDITCHYKATCEKCGAECDSCDCYDDLLKENKNTTESNAQACLYQLANELLGVSWYISSPVKINQINELIVDLLIRKFEEVKDERVR